jgi:ribonuclease kappa
VISLFAIVILSILGHLFSIEHRSMMDEDDSPPKGGPVAATIYATVFVYVVSGRLYRMI